jgi:GNAT superfamily N-acetyltransferase
VFYVAICEVKCIEGFITSYLPNKILVYPSIHFLKTKNTQGERNRAIYDKDFMKKFILILTFLTITTTIPQEISNPYTIKVLTQEKMEPLLPFIATLRINIFKEYPYLYDGDFKEEMDDLEHCAQLPNNALAIAYYKDIPVGFLYGIPLIEFASHFENPVIDLFKNKNLDPTTCYYFGDIIILPEHRGNHLSKELFDTLEAYAQKQGYNSASFITESHDIHPLKPTNYKSLDPLWTSLKYKKIGLTSYSSWKTHQPDGNIARQRHFADIWFKNFQE